MVACLLGLVMQAQVLSQCIDHQWSTQSPDSLQLGTRFSTLMDTLLKVCISHAELFMHIVFFTFSFFTVNEELQS